MFSIIVCVIVLQILFSEGSYLTQILFFWLLVWVNTSTRYVTMFIILFWLIVFCQMVWLTIVHQSISSLRCIGSAFKGVLFMFLATCGSELKHIFFTSPKTIEHFTFFEGFSTLGTGLHPARWSVSVSCFSSIDIIHISRCFLCSHCWAGVRVKTLEM